MPALRPFNATRSLALRVLDLVVILAGILILREFHHFRIDGSLLVYLLPMIAFAVLAIFQICGVYACLHRSDLVVWCLRVIMAWFVVLGFLFSGIYAFRLADDLPRLVIGPWALGTAALLVLIRVGLYGWMVSRHRRGVSRHRVLLVGDHAFCRRLARHLGDHAAYGLEIAGLVTDRPLGDGCGDRYPVLGPVDSLPRLVQEGGIDRVMVSAPLEETVDLPGRVLTLLSRQSVTVQVAPDFRRMPFVGFDTVDYGGQLVFNLTASPLSQGGMVTKWLEDKVLAGLILLLISPLLLVIALLVKLTSRGPVFFSQERHGLYGKPIRVLKFRTMTMPADAAEAAAASQGRELTDSGRFKQASGGDARITAVGRFLRRTSLDELPQFINVLKGDMSIVGPRPHPVGLNLQYADQVEGLMRRHYVKPGITGLAQISGARGETRTAADMARRVQYDMEYIKNWSLWLDLKIIAKTIWKGFVNFQP